VNLLSSDFEIFGLPVCFRLDSGALDQRWKQLQREAHPDKFAAQGQAAQRMALQWSVRINEAYDRLKAPLKRAAYLCEMHQQPIRAEDNTSMPASFLEHQIDWREQLDDASHTDALKQLESQVQDYAATLWRNCEQLIDVQADFKAAAGVVRALMFVDRFAQDLSLRLAAAEA
jgi:molecular chaperone HscB